MLNASREYTCKTCSHRFRVYADIEQGHVLQPPKACPQVLHYDTHIYIGASYISSIDNPQPIVP